MQAYHRCIKCIGSCYSSCWHVLLHKTAHPTAGLCVHIDGQPWRMALKLGITVSSRSLWKVCKRGRCFSSTWRTSECSRPCMAMDSSRSGGDHLASRTSPMPEHSPHWMRIRCLLLGRPNTSRTCLDAELGCGWQKRPRPRLGHFGVERAGHPSENMKRKQQRATRRSRRHTAVIATQHLQWGADSFVEEELSARGDSTVVARLALFGTIWCRGVPRHPHIFEPLSTCTEGFVRDQPAFSKEPVPLEASVIKTSDF